MKIETNNIVLHYTVRGAGAPLLLLHGNGEDHSIFDALTSKLQNNFTVYAIDSRNHGMSSRTEDYSYAAMMEDIHQFIMTLKLQEASVIGFSDGAIIALLLQLKYPETFGKMVLLGINLKPSDFKAENLIYLKEEYEKTKDPLLKLMLEEPNIELESLRTIKTPTLVVRAEDELFDDELYSQITSVMPNAQLLIMAEHSHDSYIVDNDALYDDLITFL